MWYIETCIRMNFLDKAVHTGNSCRAVNIVVAEYKYFFLGVNGGSNPVNSFFHVFHQPWIVEVTELRAKKLF